MNDFSELEADLKKLRPAPASADLALRIERALEREEKLPTAGVLSRPEDRTNGWWSLGLGLTAIAALLVIGLTFFDHPPQTQNVASTAANPSRPLDVPATLPPGFQPAGLTQVVFSSRDEGLLFSPNESQAPRRRLRYETRETMRWRNPQTGASVRVSYPAEQVVLTPVSFQ